MTDKQNQIEDLNQYLALNDALEQAKRQIDEALSSAPVLIRQFTKYLTESRGKYIRARALLICAMADSGLIHTDAVKCAAAVEILHLATLVHDDVIDDAAVRRGKLTLQKKFGKKTAVICGDYLFCLALSLVAAVNNREEYADLKVPDYISRICLGELNQHINNDNLDLTVRTYLKIISGKTAALFEACFFTGSILCKQDEKAIKSYKKLGRSIGMIFQLTDDCIDFEENEGAAKKTVQSDYEQGVITLPLIHTLKELPLKEKAKDRKMTRSEINKAVKKSGGISFTKGIANKYYDRSMAIIDGLDPAEAKRAGLIEILDKASRII